MLIAGTDLEGRILSALSERLMDQELVKIFCEEYVADRNRPRAGHTGIRAAQERELAKVVKDQDILVNSLLAWTPSRRSTSVNTN